MTGQYRLETSTVPAFEPLSKIITPKNGQILQYSEDEYLYVGDEVTFAEGITVAASSSEKAAVSQPVEITEAKLFTFLPTGIRKTLLYGFLAIVDTVALAESKQILAHVRAMNLLAKSPSAAPKFDTSLVSNFSTDGVGTAFIGTSVHFISLASAVEVEKGFHSVFLEFYTKLIKLNENVTADCLCTFNWKIRPLVGSGITIPEIETLLTYA